jgi:hypothetical protein
MSLNPFPAFLLLLLILFSPQDHEVNFVRENITMKIEKEYFYVNGIYYLQNSDNDRIVLTYPFPEGPDYGNVDSIFFFNLTTNDTVKILKSNQERIMFSLDLKLNEETALQVSYRQKLKSNVAKYILKSTLAWQTPLEVAFYQLIVPEYIRINQFSILPDDSLQTQHETLYYWKKSNYMPQSDMIIHFSLLDIEKH